jgi:capsular polysaccharide biosynthesis protein
VRIQILECPETVLEAISNYAGIAKANTLMAEVYRNLNDKYNEHQCQEKSNQYMEKAKIEQK